MIAFEVSLNGKRLCTAGAEDLSVLTAVVTACGRLGEKTVPARPDQKGREIHVHIGGLTARRDPNADVHVNWNKTRFLEVGDVLKVRIRETDKVDRSTARTKARRKR
jgi:hypothetical protein